MGCGSSQPEVTVEHIAALQTRISALEKELEEKNVESATYQHELIRKALVETTESATDDLAKLQDLVKSMHAAKEAMEDIQNTSSEVQEFMPAVLMEEDVEYPVTKFSLVVFQANGSGFVTISQANGKKMTIGNMLGYNNSRMGSCVVVQPGDSIRFKSIDKDDSTAFMFPIKS